VEPAVFAASAGDTGAVMASAPDAGAPADPAVELRNVSAGYGDVRVLFDIDLHIGRGQVTALFGANGAGKSTLCSVIAGLVTPSAGTITFLDEDVTRMSAHSRARKGLMLAPEARGIFPGLSVDDNLRIALPRGVEPDAVYERFPMLATRRLISAGSLSGGEQQILTIAPLVLSPPKVLVADEPSLGLAPLISREVISLLQELASSGTAVLVVEEKTANLLEIAHQFVFLELGRVAWAGMATEGNRHRVADSFLSLE
jgi:ABC-type branched-subunit amino acid transport system ATPase component